MVHNTQAVLATDLLALGRAIPAPAVADDAVEAVMARVAALPAPRQQAAPRRWTSWLMTALSRARGRAVALVTIALLALLLPTPVRAAVLDWFGFAGVIVRQDPNPPPSTAPPPPSASGTGSLDAARKAVDFQPVTLAALGTPSGVEVSPDRRVLSVTWTGGRNGTVRLDQFDGRLDYSFAKTASAVQFTEVAGAFAIWFDEPHEVVVLNRDGTSRTETARLAGHTLIWERAGVTLRLEGDLPLAHAVELAESAKPVP